MKPWFVYMVRCSDGTLYTGVTVDVEDRVKTHNAGKGAKYTRARLPVKLIWSEKVEAESEAKRREFEIKQMRRAEKILMVKRRNN